MGLTPKFKAWSIIIIAGILAAPFVLLFPLENWRGKNAWEKCQAELAAKGQTTDWKAFIPSAVPADQNFFAAPKMTEWFVGPSPSPNNELAALRDYTNLSTTTLAQITVLPPSERTTADWQNADVILRYSTFGKAFFIENAVISTNAPDPDRNVSLIIFQDITLTAAIENLTRQAHFKYSLDPRLGYGTPAPNINVQVEPTVFASWTNITARQSLIACLNENGLEMSESPATHQMWITRKVSTQPLIYLSSEDRKNLAELVAGTLNTNVLVSPGLGIFSKGPALTTPLHILIYSEQLPNPADLNDLINQLFPNDSPAGGNGQFQVTPQGRNEFSVTLKLFSPADYLKWSDQFEPDLELIRSALKRPLAQINGNYDVPYKIPTFNYVTLHYLAPMLARRADCHLLLGQSALALNDLTLLNSLRRPLESQPVTIIPTIINSAMVRLFTDVVTDGIKLNSWDDSALTTLQQNLSDINLAPQLVKAFQTERATRCTSLLNSLTKKSASLISVKKITILIPCGWYYQNLVEIAQLDQVAIEGYDPVKNVFLPNTLADIDRETKNIQDHFSPYTFFAAIAPLDSSKTARTLAYYQTLANETQIACALERFHLAHSQYPATLDELVPAFLNQLPHDLIGGQPLHYHRKDDGTFLLYSVGWNETDDVGQTTFGPGGAIDLATGDWVWGNSIP